MQVNTKQLTTMLHRYAIISCILFITMIISLYGKTKFNFGEFLTKHDIYFLEQQQTVKVHSRVLISNPNVIKVNTLENKKDLGDYFLRSQPAIKYTEEDVILFATVIYAEAGICDEMEKYRVGTVIINRVNDTTDTFKDTIESVIYQEGQFSSVGSDAWNHGPTNKEIEIAQDILEGARVFPSQVVWFNKKSPYGELYYTSDWHEFSGWKREE